MQYVLRALIVLGAGYVAKGLATASGVFPPPVPFAMMVIIVGVSGVVWWRFDRPVDLARERLGTGRCLFCGYDLTGNVSGVCPECGRVR
jgi:hypothetical protein